MNQSWWLRVYLILVAVVCVATVLGIVQGCAQFEEYGLFLGCGDDIGGMSWSWHAIYWLVASVVVTGVGTITVLALGRRPTLGSFLAWGSAGILELALSASVEIRPRELKIPLQLLMLFTIILAIPAGVVLSIVDQGEDDATEREVAVRR